jgi:preprotein translocase subunit SecD
MFYASTVPIIRLTVAVLALLMTVGCASSVEETVVCPAPTAAVRLTSEGQTSQELVAILKDRLKANNITDSCEATITATQGGSVELAVTDADLIGLLTNSGRIEFREVFQALPADSETPTGGETVLADEEGTRYVLGDSLTETQIVESALAEVSQNGQWEIRLEFTKEGGVVFDTIATKTLGRQLAIVTDQKVLSAPTIASKDFKGTALISGNFTEAEAKALAGAMDNPFGGAVTVETVTPPS